MIRDVAKAIMADDADAIEDAIEAVSEFNKKMPEFGIRSGDLRSAYRAAMKRDLGIRSERDTLLADKYNLPLYKGE